MKKKTEELASDTLPFKLTSEQQQIIKDELNVKVIKFAKGKLELDFNLTPELIEEGVLRETIRNFQNIRKHNDYHFGEPAQFLINCDEKSQIFLKKYVSELKTATNLEFVFVNPDNEIGDQEEIGKFQLMDREVMVYRKSSQVRVKETKRRYD